MFLRCTKWFRSIIPIKKRIKHFPFAPIKWSVWLQNNLFNSFHSKSNKMLVECLHSFIIFLGLKTAHTLNWNQMSRIQQMFAASPNSMGFCKYVFKCELVLFLQIKTFSCSFCAQNRRICISIEIVCFEWINCVFQWTSKRL